MAQKPNNEDTDSPRRRRLLDRVSFFEKVWKGSRITPRTAGEAEEAFEFLTDDDKSGSPIHHVQSKKRRTECPEDVGVVYREWEFVDVAKSPSSELEEMEKQISQHRMESIERSRSPAPEWQRIKLTSRRHESSSEERLCSPSPLYEDARLTPESQKSQESSNLGVIPKQLKTREDNSGKQSGHSSVYIGGNNNSNIRDSKTKRISSTYISGYMHPSATSSNVPRSPRHEPVPHRNAETLRAVQSSTRASGELADNQIKREVFTVSYTEPPEANEGERMAGTCVHIRNKEKKDILADDHSDLAVEVATDVDSAEIADELSFCDSENTRNRPSNDTSDKPSLIPAAEDEPVSMESVSSVVCEGGVRRYSSKVIIRERDTYTSQQGREAYSKYLRTTRESGATKTGVMTSEVLTTLEGSDQPQHHHQDYQEHIMSIKGKDSNKEKIFKGSRYLYDRVASTYLN